MVAAFLSMVKGCPWLVGRSGSMFLERTEVQAVDKYVIMWV